MYEKPSYVAHTLLDSYKAMYLYIEALCNCKFIGMHLCNHGFHHDLSGGIDKLHAIGNTYRLQLYCNYEGGRCRLWWTMAFKVVVCASKIQR